MLYDKVQPSWLAVGLPHVPTVRKEAHSQWQKKFTASMSVLHCEFGLPCRKVARKRFL